MNTTTYDPVAWFIQELKYANNEGMLYEFLNSCLDSLQVNDEQLIEAARHARREWDL